MLHLPHENKRQAEADRIKRELKKLVGDDPQILLIRRPTHTDIITNVTDLSARKQLVAWIRSIADQLDPGDAIIVSKDT